MEQDAMQCDVLTDEKALAALLPEWEALQRVSGQNIFTGPCWLDAWWRFVGREAGFRLHIVTGRKEGRLVAVAPLVTKRKKGVRLLQWAAGDACDYSDFLLETPEDAAPLLEAARMSRHYDVALLREVHGKAACLPALKEIAVTVRASKAYHIGCRLKSFKEWFPLLPYAMRKQYRARARKAGALGDLRFEVIRDGHVPDAAIATLIAQKREWLARRHEPGMFDAPEIGGFYRMIVDAAAKDGTLHFSRLYCGEEIIATHLGFVQGKRFLSYMPSYAMPWHGVSPGMLMMFHCIGWAFDNGCIEYDFMRGAEDYKRSLTSEARDLSDMLFARGVKGRIAQFLYLQRRRFRKTA